VFFDPPEAGTQIHKDATYAEVESVKAVSDVIAPMSGEIVEANSALADTPEKVNEDPYGEGWLVKVRLTDPSEAESLMDAAAYRPHTGQRRPPATRRNHEQVHLRHRRRPPRDARRDRRRLDGGAVRRHPRGGSARTRPRSAVRDGRAGRLRASVRTRVAQPACG